MERENDRVSDLLARKERLQREMKDALHLYGPDERTSRHRRVARLARELERLAAELSRVCHHDEAV